MLKISSATIPEESLPLRTILAEILASFSTGVTVKKEILATALQEATSILTTQEKL
jgi:hypothetical protein